MQARRKTPGQGLRVSRLGAAGGDLVVISMAAANGPGPIPDLTPAERAVAAAADA